MTVHELKCWPEPFENLMSGDKTAEFRDCRDRYFKEGDTLHMREWAPDYVDEPRSVAPVSWSYTGREVDLLVTNVIHGPAFGIPEGYCMMSVRRVGSIEAAAPDMLDALEAHSASEHHRLTCPICGTGRRCPSGEVLYNIAIDKSVAAIAKARGDRSE